MKTFILSFSIFFIGIGNTYAQKQSRSQANLTMELQTLCNLTQEQVEKIKPIIADFEKKRDMTYWKYYYHPAALSKAVSKNEWDYETRLIGILTPSQMGLVKAFDRKNPVLMTHNSSHINKVNYLADAK